MSKRGVLGWLWFLMWEGPGTTLSVFARKSARNEGKRGDVLRSAWGTTMSVVGTRPESREGPKTSFPERISEGLASFSAGTMGNVTTSKDLTGSTLLTVRDIGPDGLLGTGDDGQFTGKGDIGAIMIGGTMSGTTIAANVNPVNGIFGDGDDIALASSLEGAIKSLTVKGALIGSADTAGEHFGVVAHKRLGL